jgi:hypothetical protein
MSQAERPDLALGLVRGWLAGVEAAQRDHGITRPIALLSAMAR